jgi:DHA2 family multidrug resistance protein
VHHAQLTESISPGSIATRNFLATLQGLGLTSQQGAALIERDIEVEAHLLAANDLFLVSSLAFLALIALVWLAKAPPRTGAPTVTDAAH